MWVSFSEILGAEDGWNCFEDWHGFDGVDYVHIVDDIDGLGEDDLDGEEVCCC